jgi:L-ascorbate metabolism protein UlaG (beta-lactamase superfamily)
VEFIKPKMVVPMHYNTFDVIKADPVKFAQLVTLGNLSTCKVLSPGQAIVF